MAKVRDRRGGVRKINLIRIRGGWNLDWKNKMFKQRRYGGFEGN